MRFMADVVENIAPEVRVLPELRPWVWPWLSAYQKRGVAWAIGRRNAHLWWACGAGKTVAAIIWMLAEPGPVVVVTRASARRQWANEIRRFTTSNPFVILPTSSMRKGDIPLSTYLSTETGRPVIILGWDSLRDADLYDEIQNLPSPSIVWDEAHVAKDHRRWNPRPLANGKMAFDRRESVAARAGFLAPKARRRLALTATPVPDRTRDLWAQLDIVEPSCAGKYWDWAKRYCGAQEGEYGWEDRGSTRVNELRTWLAPRTHVVRTEDVHKLLPPLRRITTYLAPEDLQRGDAEAGKAVRTAAKLAKGGTGTENTEAAGSLLEARLLQSAARKTRHVASQVIELLQGGQKVLVFTGRRRDVTAIHERIAKKLPAGAKLWHAHGETPAEEREDIREEYMAHKGAACIVGTGAAWGESVNLQDTDRLIIVLLPWTWGQIRQWEGRVRRLGQSRACVIEYLVAEGTVDERISGVVLEKLAAVEEILPDEQVTGVREAVQGGTDEEVIDGLLDRLLEE